MVGLAARVDRERVADPALAARLVELTRPWRQFATVAG